jgi:hypothetical protein
VDKEKVHTHMHAWKHTHKQTHTHTHGDTDKHTHERRVTHILVTSHIGL